MPKLDVLVVLFPLLLELFLFLWSQLLKIRCAICFLGTLSRVDFIHGYIWVRLEQALGILLCSAVVFWMSILSIQMNVFDQWD